RRHAVVRRAGDVIFVRDLGSRNGTKIGKDLLKADERAVTAGDVITLGPVTLVVAAVTAVPGVPRTSPSGRSLPPAGADDDEWGKGIVVADDGMRKVFRLVRRLAPTPTTVLIVGPTGAGKEVVAEQLHRWSTRSGKPFVRLNCAALPEALLES